MGKGSGLLTLLTEAVVVNSLHPFTLLDRIMAKRTGALARHGEEAVEMYLAGSTLREASARFGIARQHLSRLVKKKGIPIRPHPQDVLPLHEGEVLKMQADGCTSAEIASRWGVTISAVHRFLKHRNLRLTHPRYPLASNESDVIRLCEEGRTAKEIAGRFDVDESAVRHFLDGRGVQAGRCPSHVLIGHESEILELYAANWTAERIAERYGADHSSVWSFLRRRGVEIRTPRAYHRERYPLNESAFDDAANNPEAAYWVGFLMADGCVGDDGKGNEPAVQLTLGVRDSGHVESFRRFLGSNNRIVNGGKGGMPGSGDRVTFSTRSRRLAEALARHGVVPRKSLSARVLALEGNAHFWRGCVDGDGWLYFSRQRPEYPYPTIGLCGVPGLVGQFASYVASVCGGKGPTVCRANTVWRVTVSGTRAAKIAAVMWPPGCVCLPRKAVIAAEVTRWTSARSAYPELTLAALQRLRSEFGSNVAAARALGVSRQCFAQLLCSRKKTAERALTSGQSCSSSCPASAPPSSSASGDFPHPTQVPVPF